jgi:hypothetical protein
MRSNLAACLCLLLAIWLIEPAPAHGQGEFPDVCSENPANLVQNCEFNDQMNGWGTFVETGNGPAFGVERDFPACDSPKCPALRIQANDWFVGGIYQQITNAVPGATYWANVVWLVYHPAGAIDGTVGRRIGIDPTGGTDPTSPNIVWSTEIWNKFDSCPYKICRDLQVQAVAQNTTITLFVRIANTWKNRRDEFDFVPAQFFGEPESFWIDDVGMIALGDVPPAPPTDTPVPPTDTPLPPTDTPALPEDTPVPPPDTPLSPTDTPVVEVAQVPTDTPTATLTRLPTITPTTEPTFEPTPTRRPPAPTSTPRPIATPTPAPLIALGTMEILAGGALCLGGLALLVVIAVGSGFLFWLYRLGRADMQRECELGEVSTARRQRRRQASQPDRPGIEGEEHRATDRALPAAAPESQAAESDRPNTATPEDGDHEETEHRDSTS